MLCDFDPIAAIGNQ